MNQLLRDLRNQALARVQMPSHRFFVPTENFYAALAEFKHLKFIDAGTGSGQLPDEACARGFKMLGLDLVSRPGQSKNVKFQEAESYPYSELEWLLMCRPDHSGWVYDTLETALARGAGAFYVSKPENLARDLEGYATRATHLWRDVGEAGECMLLIMPSALQCDGSFGERVPELESM